MKGKTGLSSFQEVSEVTNTLLAFTETVNDLQTRCVRQGMKPTRNPRHRVLTERKELFCSNRRHEVNISINGKTPCRQLGLREESRLVVFLIEFFFKRLFLFF